MLQPKRTKFRKTQKGRNRGLAERGSKVSFGEYALKSTGRGRITARQIEAARRAMTRHIKRGGKIWIRIFPDKPITGKPLEVRQGKGKGNVEYWVAQIQPGRVLYEVEGVSAFPPPGTQPLTRASETPRLAHLTAPERLEGRAAALCAPPRAPPFSSALGKTNEAAVAIQKNAPRL